MTHDKVLFHIDVNSAYLSWSSIENIKQGKQDLRDIPAIIGGDSSKRHGIVLAKSIPAKAYGIMTAEPILSAQKKCPHLFIQSPNHQMYSEKSAALMDFLSDFCPDLEQVSVDECYMDYSPIRKKYTSPVEAAVLIKDAVFEKFGFTVNIGVSDKKVLAKMASDFKKPNLVHTLFTEEIKEKMWPMPVSSLFMCGKSSTETLHKLGIITIGDLACSDLPVVLSHLKSHGKLLWEYANGIDDAWVEVQTAKAKGIGNSTTLSSDLTTAAEAKKTLLQLAESVSRRLRESHESAGMISCEIKYHTFQTVSHQKTKDTPISTSDAIYQTACELFDEIWDGTPIRLLGIRTSKLTDSSEPVQMSIFDLPLSGKQEKYAKTADDEKHQKLDKALDSIRNRFGENAIVRGSLLVQNNVPAEILEKEQKRGYSNQQHHKKDST